MILWHLLWRSWRERKGRRICAELLVRQMSGNREWARRLQTLRSWLGASAFGCLCVKRDYLTCQPVQTWEKISEGVFALSGWFYLRSRIDHRVMFLFPYEMVFSGFCCLRAQIFSTLSMSKDNKYGEFFFLAWVDLVILFETTREMRRGEKLVMIFSNEEIEFSLSLWDCRA